MNTAKFWLASIGMGAVLLLVGHCLTIGLSAYSRINPETLPTFIAEHDATQQDIARQLSRIAYSLEIIAGQRQKPVK
jgi:hypothetical protein